MTEGRVTAGSQERRALELPEAHGEPIAVVGAIGLSRSEEVRVSVHEGTYGPRVDVRRWVLPPRPEDDRIRAGRKAGATQRKNRFEGPTKKGWRTDVAEAAQLATLILEACGIAETWAETHEAQTA